MSTTHTWTPLQLQRLKEFGADAELIAASFATSNERDQTFQRFEKQQVKAEKLKLAEKLRQGGKSGFELLIDRLVDALTGEGFTKVATPTIISAHALAKMTVDETHPLYEQVFWLNRKQCLRPMLAPNLYSLMLDFSRQKVRPVRFFEIGSCFRKESEGANHAAEFTMLNLVEMGVPMEERMDRLRYLAHLVADTAPLESYGFEEEESAVYGSTLDLVAGPDKVEVASGAIGPHPLDHSWGIRESWVGMGFGIERLQMIQAGDKSISKWCRNLHYLDGIRLRI